MTLYQNTSVGTFGQLEDSAFEPASCNRLATNKPKQTKSLVADKFDLDAMNLSSPQRKELARLSSQMSKGSHMPAECVRTAGVGTATT